MDGSTLTYGIAVASGIMTTFLGGYLVAYIGAKRESDEKDGELNTLEIERDELQQKYSDLTDNLAAAVVLRDKHGKITYCSPFTEVLTGYARSEIYDSEEDFFYRICHESDKERLFRSFKVTELAGEPFHFHFQFYHKSGIRMWGETRTVPIIDDNDEVKATLSITFDITASMLHQKQIEEKNRELKDFTYMVSHDLKAPIFTIKGMTGVLKEDFSDVLSQSGIEILDHVAKATDRLEQLVAAVLEYSRIGQRELTMTAIDLNTVMQEVLADHHHLIEQRGVKIEFADLPTVNGDALSLSQVLSNLVGNAIKYCPSERSPHIEIQSVQRSLPHLVDITVSDNGAGIPAERIDDIFRPFVRLHSDDIEGTGIGLATVRKLLEKMGGQIKVENRDTGGAKFTVTLREA